MSFARSFRRRFQRKQASAKKPRKVHLEPLEPRILLSADLTSSVLESQALNDTSAVVITGSGGADHLTVDLDPPVPVAFDDSSSGDGDTLEIVGNDSAWHISGSDTGSVDGVDFSQIENLIGGSGDDTFTFDESATVSGMISGCRSGRRRHPRSLVRFCGSGYHNTCGRHFNRSGRL